jgi:hypothetical protein
VCTLQTDRNTCYKEVPTLQLKIRRWSSNWCRTNVQNLFYVALDSAIIIFESSRHPLSSFMNIFVFLCHVKKIGTLFSDDLTKHCSSLELPLNKTGSGAHPASYSVCTWGSCHGVKEAGARSWPLTTHLHLMPRSRMRGAILPLPNTPSWGGA